MLGTKPAYTLIVNTDTRLLHYRCISYPPPPLLIHTAPTMRIHFADIHINLMAGTKMADRNATTFPTENSLLGPVGVRREQVLKGKEPG